MAEPYVADLLLDEIERIRDNGDPQAVAIFGLETLTRIYNALHREEISAAAWQDAALKSRAEALEEAAQLCDEIQREVECQTLSAGRPFIDPEAAWRCAAAIRALKDERHE